MTSDIFKRFKDKFIFTSANVLRNLHRDFTGYSDVGYLKLLTIIRHQHHCLNLDAVIMCSLWVPQMFRLDSGYNQKYSNNVLRH